MNKTGVLLINLGTPNGPDAKNLKPYLKQFLMDPRVIDLPFLMRQLLVKGIIVPFRAKQSAKAYQAIWDPEKGSPLLYNSVAQKEALAQLLGEDFQVELGMRYGHPSIEQALQALKAHHCDPIVVLPLFPQYSSAATGSAIEETLKQVYKEWELPSLYVKSSFFDEPAYIQSKANLLNTHLNEFQPDHILLSYHGLPERHLAKGGCQLPKPCQKGQPCPQAQSNRALCYRAQCFATSKALVEHLNWPLAQISTGFQSRLGRLPWIQPYTTELVDKLAASGVKKLMVACPSFVADCLETLEEIGIQLKAQWETQPGKQLHLVPCLNQNPDWIGALAMMVHQRISFPSKTPDLKVACA